MSAQFTDADIEKRVENADGEEIGTVTAIEDDVAHVRPKSGVVDSIKAALGWSPSTETVPVRDAAVDEITDEVIRLETEPLEADEPTESPEGTERDASGPDERVPDAGGESETGTAARSGLDRPDEPGREGTDPTAEADLEDELNRGAKVEPPGEVDELDAPEGSDATGGDASGTTDASGVSTGERRRDDADSDRDSETPATADPGERAEPAPVENPTDADATGVIDGPADEAPEPDDDADAPVGSGETDGADDDAAETASMDLADELDRGTDLESVDGEGDASERTPEVDVGDELGGERDLESVAEPTEGTDTEETDLAAELDQGVDLDAAEEPAPSDGPDRDETEEADIADELDQGVDLESATETEHETDSAPGSAVDADAMPGPQVDAETASDPGARGPVPEPGGETRSADTESAVDRAVDATDPRPTAPASHAGLETEPALDRRADEPSTDEGETTDRGRRERDAASPFDAMLAAQRTALEQGQQLFEGGLAIQRGVNRMALGALGGQLALQRRSLELMGTAATSPLRAAEAMGAGQDDGREFERRLELVDGIDAMYRQRLEAAGIATLDDLALADAATVAEAAEVTEKRAADWIEQAAA